MSFHVKLYTYTGEPNRLQKSSLMTAEMDLTGTVRSEIDISNPEIMIESGATLRSHNYMYIPEFNRYYFITKSIYRNGIWNITGHVDVLMSFNAAISTCSGIVARNEKLYDTFLIDDRLRFLGYKSINTIKLPRGVKRGESYIIAVNGD